jgi:hypothetical protein
MRVEVDPALLTRLTAELRRRGIDMLLAETNDQARETVLGLIPPGATVMAGSSLTLESLAKEYKLERSLAEASYEAVLGSFSKDGSMSAVSIRNLLLAEAKGDGPRFLEQAQRELGLK